VVIDLSRRNLLASSALLLAGSGLARPGLSLGAAGAASATAPAVAPGVTGAGAQPIVLCWNENPYGPSPAARAVLSHTIPLSCRYPNEENGELIDALAAHERMPADHIVLGTGSGELLRALGLLNGRNGGEIIAAQPTYSELTDYARQSGATLKFVPVDKALKHDLTAMRAAVSAHTRAVYLCNPNNPTGTALQAAAIEAFVNSLPDGVTTIVDEAYMDFADLYGVQTVSGLVTKGKRVVVLRTFSKIHGMAGIRIGYGLARPDIINDISAVAMTSPNIFAVRAARASLGDHAFLIDTRRRIIGSRQRITRELTGLGLAYAEPQGNFVFFNTGKPLERFTELMKARNILVGRLFPPYDTWCRITIGTEPEVTAFLQALHAIPA
jgi:histidinol-phosphate aminotransferase